MFGTQSQKLASTLKKGNRIGVNGRLKQKTYEAKNGEKKNSVEIVAYTIQFLDSNPETVKASVVEAEAD
jgi:single-strand DNA-binding protein